MAELPVNMEHTSAMFAIVLGNLSNTYSLYRVYERVSFERM